MKELGEATFVEEVEEGGKQMKRALLDLEKRMREFEKFFTNIPHKTNKRRKIAK